MNKTNLQFTRDYTQIIKGIAILFMMILHVGGSGATYDVPIRTMAEYPVLGFLHPSFKLCVGIFTFMIGYGYAFAKVKDCRYSVKHVWSLLKVFWLILLVITVPSIIAIGGGSTIVERGTEDFIQNLFGVSESMNWYSWFVSLYIFCMIVLPLIHRFLDEKPILATIGFSLAFYVLEVGIHCLPFWKSNLWVHSMFSNCMLMPTVLLGYYFAKQQVYQKIRVPKHWLMFFVGIALIAAVFVVRAYCGAIVGFSLDIVYAPMAILGILIVFNTSRLPVTSMVLTKLGNLSVYMWFFHAIFFTDVVRKFYQPFILVSSNIFIITIWTIFLTYTCCWLLKKGVDEAEYFFSK